MNPLKAIGRLFAGLGRLIAKAFTAAHRRGLTDAVVAHALGLAKQALGRFLESAERREWAVAQLRADLNGIPESTARLAVELAVQMIKDAETS